jgi:hypothetical protein
MTGTPAIAWHRGSRRYVGRYVHRGAVLRLEGTTMTARRELAVVDLPLDEVLHGLLVWAHGNPAALIQLRSDVYVIEFVTGGKAEARTLLESIRA